MNVATKEREVDKTVAQVAQDLNLSEAIIRRYCRNGELPDATYHQFPGTNRGYYTLTKRSIDWLRENVFPRKKGVVRR